MYDSLFEKDMSAKIESGVEDQVTYWEGMMMSHNISLSKMLFLQKTFRI